MIYIIKQNLAKRSRQCQIFKQVQDEKGEAIYKHIYEDSAGKPLLIDSKRNAIYFKSNKKGIIELIKLDVDGQVKDVVNINTGCEEIVGFFKLQMGNKNQEDRQISYDLIFGS